MGVRPDAPTIETIVLVTFYEIIIIRGKKSLILQAKIFPSAKYAIFLQVTSPLFG